MQTGGENPECSGESISGLRVGNVLGSVQHGNARQIAHPGGYDNPFYEAIEKMDLTLLPVFPETLIHFLGPHDIQRLRGTTTHNAN